LPPFREDYQMNPITQESLELLKGALAKPNDTLAKSISRQRVWLRTTFKHRPRTFIPL